jgi:hypothetical protein
VLVPMLTTAAINKAMTIRFIVVSPEVKVQ